jgi:Arc/MetJ-type ribon-helix-helix transcriptional regulator
MPTKPTQMRLGPKEREKIERIREAYGLPSASAAVRFAVQQLPVDPIDSRRKIPRGKSPAPT